VQRVRPDSGAFVDLVGAIPNTSSNLSMSARIKRPRCVREAHSGRRAKTSAHLVVKPFRSVSACAGFEPSPSIHLVMKTFEFGECRLAIVERIFIVALAAAEVERWMFLKCGRSPMAQTRRMGMRNERAQLPNAPRSLPCHYELSRARIAVPPMPHLNAYLRSPGLVAAAN
jgi:hypothetical protein